MKLGLRIFLGFFLIVGLAAFAVLRIFAEEVKPGVRQGMEVAMVDMANLLAEVARQDLETGQWQGSTLGQVMARYTRRDLRAQIWGRSYREPQIRVYVTDSHGRVVFDSNGTNLGQDFSRWNDVARTLRGAYGARSTRLDPGDPSSSSMYVAAPILREGKIIGSLTVVAPTAAVQPYATRSREKVLLAGALLMGAALLVGALLTAWLGRSVGRLRTYARLVAEGKPARMPLKGNHELAELGQTLERMREKLEGRQYVERYVQQLTHEMKSPLAAVRGAAELLREPMPEADRERFLQNILGEEAHLRRLIDRMLTLAKLQHRQEPMDPEEFSVEEWVRKVLDALQPAIAKKHILLQREIPPGLRVHGEWFLLEQALRNLLDNALAFSPDGGQIRITAIPGVRDCRLQIRDQGPGVPDWARERLFSPFFSIAGPGSDTKGTGLGLAFVKEVALVHGGSVALENAADGGAEASLVLPLAGLHAASREHTRPSPV